MTTSAGPIIIDGRGKLRTLEQEEGASEDVGKEDGERDCWNNCDYPSQCYCCHTHSLGAWLETGLETEEDEKLREALDTLLCPSVNSSIVVGSHGAEKGDETVEDVSQAIGDDTKIEGDGHI